MNVRGLRDSQKRKELFLYIAKMKYDIVFLQETHSDKDNETIWRSEWGGQAFFAHGDTQSKGVTILIKPNVCLNAQKVVKDLNGWYILIDVCMNEKKLCLVNIYAQNEDNPDFFVKVIDRISEMQSADIIMGGDFNLVIKEHEDSYNRKTNNKNALNILNGFLDEALMIDVWRQRNPESFQFTYYKKKPHEMYARLDYIFVNYALVNCVQKTAIVPSYKRDHSAVKVKLELDPGWKRGPGFWKLNTALIQDLEMVNKINMEIEDIKIKTRNYEDKGYRWECIKERVIQKCQELSKLKANKINDTVKKLHNQLIKLQNDLNKCQDTILEKNALQEQLDEYTHQLNKFVEYKAKGSRIRCRTRWYEEGEKSTKYFLGLEKMKYSNKTLNKILCSDGSVTRDEKKILKEQAKFYKKLYSSNDNIVFAMTNETSVMFNQEDKLELDAPFTFQEFTNAMKSMARNKAPGNSGLPVEFYIMFLNKIGEEVWEAMQYVHKIGKLHLSARRGIISLIPKKLKDPLYIKNWRPLTLLNTDHKILTKMLTLRLKPFLEKVIECNRRAMCLVDISELI